LLLLLLLLLLCSESKPLYQSASLAMTIAVHHYDKTSSTYGLAVVKAEKSLQPPAAADGDALERAADPVTSDANGSAA
jgi:hypothetical protein